MLFDNCNRFFLICIFRKILIFDIRKTAILDEGFFVTGCGLKSKLIILIDKDFEGRIRISNHKT